VKEFHPPPPFSADKNALDKFIADSYFKNVKVLTLGRSWGLIAGPGVGTFLMATAWCGSSLFVQREASTRTWSSRRLLLLLPRSNQDVVTSRVGLEHAGDFSSLCF
jgi:hypothetical protein